MSKTKALARVGYNELAQLGELARANPTAALAKVTEMECNALVPMAALDQVPEGMALSFRLVQISTEKDVDTYPTDGGKMAIKGERLNALASSSGVSFPTSKRIGDTKHPHYVEWCAVARMQDFDGSVREAPGNASLDFRDDTGDGTAGADLVAMRTTAERKGRDPTAQIIKKRQKLLELAESTAKNRALRQLLSIRSSYTRQQLERPFIVAKLISNGKDPDAKRAMLAQATGAAQMMYGRGAEREIIDVTPVEPQTIEQHETIDAVSVSAPAPLSFDDVVARAKDLGLDRAAFVGLCQDATGKAKRGEYDQGDFEKVNAALDKYEQQAEDAADGDGWGGY